MEALSESQCYELLDTAVIGRVGLTAKGEQTILPVNYALDEHSIVIKVAQFSTLAEYAPMTQVVFEVDHLDEAHQEGWSVLLRGMAHDVTNAIEITTERLHQLSISPWAPGEKPIWLKINPREISGRRVP